jgi:putative RNA 2'-phosphotransferase
LKTSSSSNLSDTLLSKAVSQALRHDPTSYGLTLDDSGAVEIQDLVAALKRVNVGWVALDEKRIREMVEHSGKRRHEIVGSRIRALYGHSTPERLSKCLASPPELLYHGTDAAAANRILAEGLRPMGRQYVHLSADVQTAQAVGRRKDEDPVILRIAAQRAHEQGVMFYQGNETVWLADYVPVAFISSCVEPHGAGAPANE